MKRAFVSEGAVPRSVDTGVVCRPWRVSPLERSYHRSRRCGELCTAAWPKVDLHIVVVTFRAVRRNHHVVYCLEILFNCTLVNYLTKKASDVRPLLLV